MTEEIIDNEWSSLALDDGTILKEYHDLDLVIGGDDAEKITASPTNVRYSPSVNKAKNAKFDVPPDSRLENLTYLGENIKFYVDRELAFDGEIRAIDSQQKEGQDYSITARPAGKKLSGSDVEENVNNEIFSDRISKLVDEFNEIDNRHEDLVNTSDEELSGVIGVGGNVRAVDNVNSGLATYENIGTDATRVTSIYIKAYTPEDAEILANITTGLDTHNFTIDGLDKNRYGEWIRIQPDFSDPDTYKINFTIDNGALLIDWVSVVEEKVSRETTAPEVNTIAEDIPFYSRSGSELENNITSIGDGLLINNNGEPRTRQISEWSSSPFPFLEETDFVDGQGGEIETDESQVQWDFSPSDSLEDWGLYARTKPYEIFVNRNETHTLGNTIYDNSWDGSAASSTEQIAVQDSSVKITGNADKRFQWTYRTSDVTEKLRLESQAYLTDTSTIEWVIQAGPFETSDTQDGYGISIGNGSFELIRWDAGSTTVLDTTSYTRQQDEWFDWSITIDDEGVDVSLSDSNASYNLSSSDTTHTEFGEFAIDTNSTHYLDDMFAEVGNTIQNITLDVQIDTARLDDVGLLLEDTSYREWSWTELVASDFYDQYPNPIQGSTEVYVEASPRNEHAFIISPLVFVHKNNKWDEQNDFDVTVDSSNGHLDYPHKYATGQVFDNTVEFSEEVSNTNIFTSSVDSDVSIQSSIVGKWGPSQVIDLTATDFPQPVNSPIITDRYSYPGVQHTVQYTLSSGGLRDTDSPRRGFKKQVLNSYSVEYSTNDLEILFDRDLSNNRLALMNTLAEDSSVLFRWENNHAKIFHQGQETTDVDLDSENITSSVSIEDVYASCEVIGLHNVRSGVIASDDAPDFVDDHKTIRSEDIETEIDAINRARRFLSNHGSIKYKGKIKTLPTFAPIGAEVDGSLFNHGQDMVIRGVSYGKRGTKINLGYEKDISTELISLQIGTQSTKGRASSKGMTIPVGEDQI
jgi:hypothetical protein